MRGDVAERSVQLSGEEVAVRAHERGSVVTRCSIARGRSLPPGVQKTPFYWRDVVHGPPPRRKTKGDCTHVTFHGTDDSGDVRIAFTTLVRVDPGLDKEAVHDDVAMVEERLYVQRRVLQELIDRERAFTDKIALRMRSRLAHSLVSQRRAANGIELAWLATVALFFIRLQAKVGNATIQGFRGMMRALVAIPDAILVHTERASIHLASRSGRRWLKKAIRDPGSAKPQEKAGVLVWLCFALLGWFLVLSLVFATVLAPWSPYFAEFLTDFSSSLLGTVALPFPAELTFIGNFGFDLNFAAAAGGIFAGKMIGSWMLYLLGDSLFDGLKKKSKTSPRLGRSIAWLQRNANKYGFLMLVLMNGIPLAPDAFIIVFAVSGMRFRSFMLGIAVGSLLKFAILTGLILAIGAGNVEAFMAHPIQTMMGGSTA